MLKTILNEWFERSEAVHVEPLDVGSGLSGSAVWKVSARPEQYCLKRWSTDHFAPERLLAQHQLLRHVREEGFHLAPIPLANRRGETVVQAAGHLWDLTTWMPGTSLTRQSLRGDSLRKALHFLARFHTAAQSLGTPTLASSPGLQQRVEIVRALREGELAELLAPLRNGEVRAHQLLLLQIAEHLERTIPVALNKLSSICKCPLPLQWCLRDVKYDHVLFEQGTPSGLIDYGAAAIESVAGDIARLIGSLNDVAETDWQLACECYCEVRPLSRDEQAAITLFDIGGVIGAAANWLRWLVVEGRQFTNQVGVEEQLTWLANRLQAFR